MNFLNQPMFKQSIADYHQVERFSVLDHELIATQAMLLSFIEGSCISIECDDEENGCYLLGYN